MKNVFASSALLFFAFSSSFSLALPVNLRLGNIEDARDVRVGPPIPVEPFVPKPPSVVDHVPPIVGMPVDPTATTTSVESASAPLPVLIQEQSSSIATTTEQHHVHPTPVPPIVIVPIPAPPVSVIMNEIPPPTPQRRDQEDRVGVPEPPIFTRPMPTSIGGNDNGGNVHVPPPVPQIVNEPTTTLTFVTTPVPQIIAEPTQSAATTTTTVVDRVPAPFPL